MEPKKANRAIALTAIVAILLILLCLCLLFDWIQFPKNQEEPTSDNAAPVVVNVTNVSTPTPTPSTPSPKRPSVDDLKGSSDKLTYPKEENYLEDYETYTVQPESGKTAFLLYKPEPLKYTSDRIIDLEKDTVVTAVAKENGYTLVLVQDGVAGWIATQELKQH